MSEVDLPRISGHEASQILQPIHGRLFQNKEQGEKGMNVYESKIAKYITKKLHLAEDVTIGDTTICVNIKSANKFYHRNFEKTDSFSPEIQHALKEVKEQILPQLIEKNLEKFQKEFKKMIFTSLLSQNEKKEIFYEYVNAVEDILNSIQSKTNELKNTKPISATEKVLLNTINDDLVFLLKGKGTEIELSKLGQFKEKYLLLMEIPKTFNLDLKGVNVEFDAEKNFLIATWFPSEKEQVTLKTGKTEIIDHPTVNKGYIDQAKMLFQKFLAKAGPIDQSLLPAIKFTALMIVMKTQEEDPESVGVFWNVDFLKILNNMNIEGLDIKKLNSMERVFLKTIDYDLSLTKND